MLVISFREFREKQGFYEEKLQNGEEFLLTFRSGLTALVKRQNEDDTLMSKEDYFDMLDRSLAQYDRGEYISMNKGESVDNFVNRIVCTN